MVSTKLRPFFYYYGGKWRDAVKHYPEPAFGTIIEPFAGATSGSPRFEGYFTILLVAQ